MVSEKGKILRRGRLYQMREQIGALTYDRCAGVKDALEKG